MNGAPALQRLTGFWRHGRWRPGVQLAAAVALAWAVASALRLPESFWAVMSVLIVMRPSAGSTLDAGWDRVRGPRSPLVAARRGGRWRRHGPRLPRQGAAAEQALAWPNSTAGGARVATVRPCGCARPARWVDLDHVERASSRPVSAIISMHSCISR
jgi:hypothetical protein